MTDGVIKGDGTSRLAKASGWPETYEEFKALAESSGIPFDLIFNSDGWQQLPTFLNKANLLSDETAKRYRLTDDTTVNKAFYAAFDTIPVVYLDNFYTSSGVSRGGNAASLREGRRVLAATSIGDYAIFAGGYKTGGETTGKVEAYNSKLVISEATELSVSRISPGAMSTSTHAIFAGGNNSMKALSDVDAYNSSLVRSTATILSRAGDDIPAARAGDYAVFVGGDYRRGYVDAYSPSLVRTFASDATCGTIPAAASAGVYALFAGGSDDNGSLNIVNAYNDKLIKTTPTTLATARSNGVGVNVADSALIAGGSSSSNSILSSVEVYNKSLVRSSATSLSKARYNMKSAVVGEYSIIIGGYDGSADVGTVDAYSASLVHSTSTPLNTARVQFAAASIGNYAIVAGGSYTGNSYGTSAEYFVFGYTSDFTIPAMSKFKFDGYHSKEQLTLKDLQWNKLNTTSGITGYIKRGGFTLSGDN